MRNFGLGLVGLLLSVCTVHLDRSPDVYREELKKMNYSASRTSLIYGSVVILDFEKKKEEPYKKD